MVYILTITILQDLDDLKTLIKHKLDLGGVDYSSHPNSLNQLTKDLQRLDGATPLYDVPSYSGASSVVDKLNVYKTFLENVIEFNVGILPSGNRGFTTLVNLIKFTPTVTLTSNPSFASTGDTVGFTATVSFDGNPVSGLTLTIYTSGGTVVGSGTSDSNGQVNISNYTLTSDNVFYATSSGSSDYVNVTSQNISISNVLWYDNCTTNENLNVYNNPTVTMWDGSANGQVTYNSNGYYICQNVSNSNGRGTIILDTDENFEFKVRGSIRSGTSSNNNQWGCFIRYNNSNYYCKIVDAFGTIHQLEPDGSKVTGSSESFNIDKDTYYLFKLTRNDGSLTFKIYNSAGTILLASKSATFSALVGKEVSVGFFYGGETGTRLDINLFSCERL